MGLLVVDAEFMDAVTDLVTQFASKPPLFFASFKTKSFCLKSPLETVGALFSVDELAVGLFLDREASTVVFGDFVGVSDVGLMFLVDLLIGITGGGFVVKLSALM